MNGNVAFAISKVNSQSDISRRYTRPMDRREAVKRLIDERFGGKQADFARAINRSPSLVWQCLNGHRNIGEKLAREIENKLRLKPGWLDGPSIESTLPGQLGALDSDDNPPAASSSEIDLLLASASPRSRQQLLRIAQAAADGRLSEADIKMLSDIAKRLEKGSTDHRDDYPNFQPDPADQDT
ncbi:helix-turn-helix domain-containing protein [Marinobacter sp. CA1]|uniref:helix-turn-helix domain-containing protein n=1 Tax=Marinobacter sp. CA1 TaxID=2817656 RepID=UPI001D08BF1E|nr:helix-turn-helix transcriptional regulator [Marinobacter sp. CA1]UDL04003.1 hypothetical protein J2887_14940 [Marinobacter sp. CA1]